MLKNSLFGQYKYRNSLVHRFDPRLKIFYVVALSILVFTIDEPFKILTFSFFIIIIIVLSKLGIRHLIKGLRPFFFIFVFILAMYAVFSRNQLEQGIIALWRFLMLIVISLIITFTTTISSLVTAIEKLIKPLKILNIKPRNIAVMISITIRFAPVMLINLEKLKETMLSRLADFRKLKNIKLLMLTLLEKMFKSASNLSDAMQSRLYNENTESHKTLKLGRYDYVSIVFILMIMFIIY
ncbi:MAG: energy-coupling factor transporter transmembrane component T [Nanoarchaeota archaeon]|nr:energy-coupling factor transporter transmembrane component T [Nanoarchaeota archaeon]